MTFADLNMSWESSGFRAFFRVSGRPSSIDAPSRLLLGVSIKNAALT